MKRKIVYYQSFSEDIVTNHWQDYELPDTYNWIPEQSAKAYHTALQFARFYCRKILHADVICEENMRLPEGRGFFLYANHTQPQADVCLPTWAVFEAFRRKKLPAARCYTVVGAANMGIPVIGKILPSLGALPIPSNRKQLAKFTEAMRYWLSQGCGIVIFPEAHVWPYYTGIRPYADTSFSYPVACDRPAYCMTVTYQRRGRYTGKPKITIYLDGPFEADLSLHPKEARKVLCKQVRACMEHRSGQSNYAYWEYRCAKDAGQKK